MNRWCVAFGFFLACVPSTRAGGNRFRLPHARSTSASDPAPATLLVERLRQRNQRSVDDPLLATLCALAQNGTLTIADLAGRSDACTTDTLAAGRYRVRATHNRYTVSLRVARNVVSRSIEEVGIDALSTAIVAVNRDAGSELVLFGDARLSLPPVRIEGGLISGIVSGVDGNADGSSIAWAIDRSPHGGLRRISGDRSSLTVGRAIVHDSYPSRLTTNARETLVSISENSPADPGFFWLRFDSAEQGVERLGAPELDSDQRAWFRPGSMFAIDSPLGEARFFAANQSHGGMLTFGPPGGVATIAVSRTSVEPPIEVPIPREGSSRGFRRRCGVRVGVWPHRRGGDRVAVECFEGTTIQSVRSVFHMFRVRDGSPEYEGVLSLPVQQAVSSIAAPLGLNTTDELAALVVTRYDYSVDSRGSTRDVNHVVRVWLLRENVEPLLLSSVPQAREVIAVAQVRMSDLDDEGRLLLALNDVETFQGATLSSFRLDHRRAMPVLTRDWVESFPNASIVISGGVPGRF